jgi:hypothetical protein
MYSMIINNKCVKLVDCVCFVSGPLVYHLKLVYNSSWPSVLMQYSSMCIVVRCYTVPTIDQDQSRFWGQWLTLKQWFTICYVFWQFFTSCTIISRTLTRTVLHDDDRCNAMRQLSSDPNSIIGGMKQGSTSCHWVFSLWYSELWHCNLIGGMCRLHLRLCPRRWRRCDPLWQQSRRPHSLYRTDIFH